MTLDSGSTSRGRPCSAQSEGNVPPATPLDRHTGRVALATSDQVLPPSDPGGVRERDATHPAGSRDSGWRSPPWGSGEGELRPLVGEALSTNEGRAILRSYSESKCSSQEPGGERDAWLRRVGHLTKAFRAERAMYHRGRARYMLDIGRLSTAEYHLKRSEGQRRRFENVMSCGSREVVISCQDCGYQQRKSTARCGHHRLCLTCRGHRARRYRVKIRIARRRVLEEFETRRKARGLRLDWRERLMTLTIPHSGDVIRDLKVLPEAWKLFRRWLWDFFRHEHRLDQELLKHVCYVRVTEVTGEPDREK